MRSQPVGDPPFTVDHITVEERNGVQTFSFPMGSELDTSTHGSLRDFLVGFVEAPCTSALVLDIAGVTFLGSDALLSLAETQDMARKHDKHLVIDATENPIRPNLMKLFQIESLRDRLNIVFEKPDSDSQL
jgi:anti-anti-sigma regulatory factor